jgi:ABC-type Zn uptake system ZnuABC Zn-binding protein ZnuA
MNNQTSRFRILLLLLCLGSTAIICAQKEEPKKPLVISSSSVFANMVSIIGGNLIESVSIVPIGGDPHTYRPTSKDATLVSKADLIVQNGLDYEPWINDLIKNNNTKASVITLTEGIIPIISKKNQHTTDPHAWLEPANGKIYAHNIKNGLLQLLPESHEQISFQFDAFLEELYKLDEYVRKSIGKIETNKKVLITSHDSFLYFGRQYGFVLEPLAGNSTDTEVSSSELLHLNELVQTLKIPVAFSESTIKPKLIKKFVKDNKISIGGTLYSDSLGDKESPATTYLNMIRQNTDVIVAGLTSAMTPSGASTSGISPRTLQFLIMAVMVVSVGIFLIRRRIFAG